MVDGTVATEVQTLLLFLSAKYSGQVSGSCPGADVAEAAEVEVDEEEVLACRMESTEAEMGIGPGRTQAIDAWARGDSDTLAMVGLLPES